MDVVAGACATSGPRFLSPGATGAIVFLHACIVVVARFDDPAHMMAAALLKQHAPKLEVRDPSAWLGVMQLAVIVSPSMILVDSPDSLFVC